MEQFKRVGIVPTNFSVTLKEILSTFKGATFEENAVCSRNTCRRDSDLSVAPLNLCMHLPGKLNNSSNLSVSQDATFESSATILPAFNKFKQDAQVCAGKVSKQTTHHVNAVSAQQQSGAEPSLKHFRPLKPVVQSLLVKA